MLIKWINLVDIIAQIEVVESEFFNATGRDGRCEGAREARLATYYKRSSQEHALDCFFTENSEECQDPARRYLQKANRASFNSA
jgi:hypothetical protein